MALGSRRPGAALVLLLVACAAPSADGRRICDFTQGSVCHVTSNRTISRPMVLRWSGSIQFTGARWTCVSRPTAYESIRIDISVTNRIGLSSNSVLHCATVALEARIVEVSDSSEVTANGTSFAAEPYVAGMDSASVGLFSSEQQKGASHGGLGGTPAGCSDDAQLAKRVNLIYGDPIAPWSFGRAAATSAGRGLGGGRLRIIASEVLVLNGTLSASGMGPEEEDDDSKEEKYTVAAGSGGSIWISARTIKQPGTVAQATVTSLGTGAVDFVDELGAGESAHPLRAGRIEALGGCCAKCLCGGGGRILTEIAAGPQPRHVFSAGGCWREASDSNGEADCRCGSAGPWVLRQVPAGKKRRKLAVGVPAREATGPNTWLPRWLRDRRLLHVQRQPPPPGTVTTVYVDNSHAVSVAGTKLSQPTPVAAFDEPVTLSLHDAVVVPVEEEPAWTLTGLGLMSDQIGSTLRHLHTKPLTLNFTQQNKGVELAFSSTLVAHELSVVGADNIVLRQNAAIDAKTAVLMANEEIDTHQGALGQGTGSFELAADRAIVGGGRLRMARVVVREELIVKGGSRLRSSHRRCDQLPAPVRDPCEAYLKGPVLDKNQSIIENVTFDIVLAAQNGSIVVEDGSELHAAAVLLCATGNASVAGLVSARGLGCPPNRGESAGAAPEGAAEPPGESASRGVAGSGNFSSSSTSCGGGGGAHCGSGGDGVQNRSRTTCSGTGGQKYDGWWASETAGTAKPSRLPTWSASGGGGQAAGAGGGILWIQAGGLELPSNGTSVSASGDDGTPWLDGSPEGAGGGAGGSVIINVSLVVGTGVMEAAGGRGGGCIGGGGGGGAIGSAGPNASQAWERFEGQLVVDGGTADPSPACSKSLGKTGGEGELLQFGVCRPGEAGIFCAKCPPGTYNPPHRVETDSAEYRICLPCKNKPMHGNYTAFGWLNESCPYACPGGFPPMEVNPNCDDPWTYYFAFFGGVWGVVSSILVIAFLFGFSLSASHLRRLKRLQWLRRQRMSGQQFHGLDDEVLLLFESVRGRHPLADLNLGRTGRGSGGALFAPAEDLRAFVQRLLQPFQPFQQPQSAGTAGKAHLLCNSDLPYHAARIYLLGENSPEDPWRLPRRPPDELAHLIDPDRWAAFSREIAARCNEKMRMQRMAEGILRWLYLPLAEYLRWRLRLSRAAEVAQFVWSSSEASRPDQTFWRLIRDSSSRFGLKFGTDWQMTLGYVDVLDYGKSIQDWVVKPQLPMVICAGGDGQYTAPYHLDYADPFVQSVSQYVGRRTWHQVLLAFNVLARLLPANPTEDDIKPLRHSMARVSARVLKQTDLACHAVAFEALQQSARRAPQKETMSRQTSFVTTDFLDRMGRAGSGSFAPSPDGGRTPVLGPGTNDPKKEVYRRRLALVLTQRAVRPTPTGMMGGMTGTSRGHFLKGPKGSPQRHTQRVPSVVQVGFGSLVSPAECLLESGESPAIGAIAATVEPPETLFLDDQISINAGGTQSFELSAENFLVASMDSNPDMPPASAGGAFRSSQGSRSGSPRSELEIDVELDESLPPKSPGVPPHSAYRDRFWGTPTHRSRTPHGYQQVDVFFRDLRHRRGMSKLKRLLEALIQCFMTPGVVLYNFYLSKLRNVRALGGIGRQPGLYLRHRKPRGSQVTTLLCLILSLMVATFCFVAESAVLFRLGPSHGAFFVALLAPPFADILAIVFGVLFVCGAAEGTVVVLFVVASNCNTALGLISRMLAMDTLHSVGFLHMLLEYLIAFSVKIVTCRMVNLMIAYADAEPSMLEPAGNEADHEWVREHVLFRRVSRENLTSGSQLRSSPSHLFRPASLEELPETDDFGLLVRQDRDRKRAVSDETDEGRPSNEPVRQVSSSSNGSDGWTPQVRGGLAREERTNSFYDL